MKYPEQVVEYPPYCRSDYEDCHLCVYGEGVGDGPSPQVSTDLLGDKRKPPYQEQVQVLAAGLGIVGAWGRVGEWGEALDWEEYEATGL